jgi:hypothetical protein
LWDKHRFRVLRIILGPKLDKATWDRRVHNMELYEYSPIIIWVTKKNEMGEAYEGEDRCIQGVRGERCGKETAWKTLA